MWMKSYHLVVLLLCALSSKLAKCADNNRIELSTDLIYYNFTTCGKSGHLGPSLQECKDHYQQIGSPIPDRLFSPANPLPGVQYFTVPRSGRYILTISGGRGGKGVCTHWPGISPVVQSVLEIQKETKLEVVAGHHGVDACANNRKEIELCDWSITSIADAVNCSTRWMAIASEQQSGQALLYDGGGGAGGASVVRYEGTNDADGILIMIGGGGGESAIFPSITLSQNESRAAKKNAKSDNSFTVASGIRPVSAGSLTAGRGGGVTVTYGSGAALNIDGKPFGLITNSFAQGGEDCYPQDDSDPYFPNTYGGFGGGGGGCGNGGGGGGYGGGNVPVAQNNQHGIGGFSKRPDGSEVIGENHGDGFVSFRLEHCGCAGNCSIDYERSVFWCTCPVETTPALDGLDCYTENEVNFTKSTSKSQLIEARNFGQIRLIPLKLVHQTSLLLLGLRASVTLSGRHTDSFKCGVLIVNINSKITGVLQLTQEKVELEFLHTVMQDESTGNVTFAISSDPVQLLNGPIEFGKAYLYYTEGMPVDVTTITGNISITKGRNTSMIEDLDNSTLVKFFSSLYEANNPTVNDTGPTSPATPLPEWFLPAILGAVLALLIIVLFCIIFCIITALCLKKRKKNRIIKLQFIGNSIYNLDPEIDGAEVVRRVKNAHDPQTAVPPQNAYSTVRAFRRKSKMMSMSMNAGDEVKGHSLPRAYADLTVPNYGVEVPQGVDFAKYNESRTDKNDKAWYFPRERLTYMRELGEGEFGKVLLMSANSIAGYNGNFPVAVKTLSRSRMKDIDKFMQEVNVMKKFSHPNVISLLGVCPAEEDAAPMMILELMPYGDLQSFLLANKPEPDAIARISIVEMVQFAFDIASALEYIELKNYVHRDVAARNCLVGSELTVKLADFGMARGIKDQDFYKLAGKAKLPVKWMAPESILYGEFSSASDVWSFGVLLWEIASYGKAPLQEYSIDQVVQLAESNILSQCHLSTKPEDCPNELVYLMEQCLVNTAAERPHISKLKMTLDDYSDEDYRLEEVHQNDYEHETIELSPIEENPELGCAAGSSQYSLV